MNTAAGRQHNNTKDTNDRSCERWSPPGGFLLLRFCRRSVPGLLLVYRFGHHSPVEAQVTLHFAYCYPNRELMVAVVAREGYTERMGDGGCCVRAGDGPCFCVVTGGCAVRWWL